MSALASLAANFTDSEEEKDEEEETSGVKPATHVDRFRSSAQPSPAGSVQSGSQPPSNRSTPTKKMRLVSYGGDEDDLDKSKNDEDDSDAGSGDDDVEGRDSKAEVEERRDDEKGSQEDKTEAVPMELDTDDENAKEAEEKRDEDDLNASAVEVEAWSRGCQLPPEPAGTCNPRLQENIARLYEKKKQGYDMNAVIQNKKAFRNPSIYDKLIDFCEIDEHGTNFPKELCDAHLFGKESYYDELAKAQAADMERREKAAKARAKAGESSKKVDPGAGATKRKSKWDQAAPSGAVPPPGVAKSISAFGPLK